MGIRQKIIMGFFSLGALLFFSGLMSFFELKKLSNSTQSMLEVSVKNMELSKAMLDAVQDQNTSLLQMIALGSVTSDTILLIEGRRKFDEALSDARISVRDINSVDSIYSANIRYNEVVNSHFHDPEMRANLGWFVDMYKTSYSDLTKSIKNYMVSSQNIMDAKAMQLERNAYRAIMPGVIALAIAILIILIFFYFVDIYYIRPVLKITSGLHNYLTAKIPFKITMEGRDEVFKLKEYIDALITQLKSKKNE